MNLINNENIIPNFTYENPYDSVSIREKILFADFLVDIFKYLSLKELYISKSSCKLFQNLIDKEDSIIFDKVNFSYKEENFSNSPQNFFLIWLFKIIKRNKVKCLNLLFCYNHNISRIFINSVNPESLEKLKIHVKIFKTGFDLTHLKNLKSLSVKNMFYDQSDFDDNIKAITNIVKMSWIEQLKLNNIKFVNCFFLELTKNKFNKLDFTESAEFKIQDMTVGIKNFLNSLKILRLDGEFSNEDCLINTLTKLENLEELYIGYCQNFSDKFLTELNKNKFSLRKLSLRKLRVSSSAIENFFESGDFRKIEKFDFYDCPSLNNNCVNSIANRAINLEFLEISWSSGVRDDSVINLFRNCVKLRFVYLQGCKYLTDKIFNEILDRNKYSFDSFANCTKHIFYQLRLIDLSKCDLIQDRILFKIMKEFPCLHLINYYGVDLRDEMMMD